MRRPLALIAAHDEQRVIGHRGRIPWHCPADMRFFRRTTLHHAVIMGRATYESLNKPLAKRHNIVLTRRRDYQAPGCRVCADLDDALAAAYALDPEPFIIGGAELYRMTLPVATTLYITLIPGTHPGDTYFPPYEDDFAVEERTQEDGLIFLTLHRRAQELDRDVDRATSGPLGDTT